MLKKLILLFISILMINLVYSTCSLNYYDNSCDYVTSPYQIFDVDVTPFGKISDIKVEIYNKNEPGNKIRTRLLGQSSFENVDPITKSGVYIFEVIVTKFNGAVENKKYEFLYDNTKPKPVIVETNLEFTGNSFILSGISNPKNSVEVRDSSGSVIGQSIVNLDGSFQISLNVNEETKFISIVIMCILL